MIIGIFGACKVFELVYSATIFYLILMLLFCTFSAVFAILMFDYSSEFRTTVTYNFGNLLDQYPKDKKFIDNIQTTFECCGNDEDDGWEDSSSFNGSFPDSCCNKTILTGKTKCNAEVIYVDKCITKLEDSIKFYSDIIYSTSAISSVLLLFLATLAFFLLTNADYWDETPKSNEKQSGDRYRNEHAYGGHGLLSAFGGMNIGSPNIIIQTPPPPPSQPPIVINSPQQMGQQPTVAPSSPPPASGPTVITPPPSGPIFNSTAPAAAPMEPMESPEPSQQAASPDALPTASYF